MTTVLCYMERDLREKTGGTVAVCNMQKRGRGRGGVGWGWVGWVDE